MQFRNAASATFYYIAQKERHPGPQLPFDPSKKTLVILGSGWGATSLLKGLDTSEYNTVRLYSNCKAEITCLLHDDPPDCHLPKELLPFHASPSFSGCRHIKRKIHYPAYVSFLSTYRSFGKITTITATRYMTRHKSRQVLVIEADAKEVDVRRSSYLELQIFKCVTMVAG